MGARNARDENAALGFPNFSEEPLAM